MPDHDMSRSEVGTVMVDIGGDRGALIVWTGAELHAEEIELHRVGTEWDGTHVAVRERQVGSGVRHAALFPSLQEGDYELRLRPPRPGGDVVPAKIEGAKVAEITWPA